MLPKIVAALVLCTAVSVYAVVPAGAIICHNEEFGLVKAFYGVQGCPEHFTLFAHDGLRGPVGQVSNKTIILSCSAVILDCVFQ